MFDDAIVKGGNVPLTLLSQATDDYIARQRKSAAARVHAPIDTVRVVRFPSRRLIRPGSR